MTRKIGTQNCVRVSTTDWLDDGALTETVHNIPMLFIQHLIVMCVWKVHASCHVTGKSDLYKQMHSVCAHTVFCIHCLLGNMCDNLSREHILRPINGYAKWMEYCAANDLVEFGIRIWARIAHVRWIIIIWSNVLLFGMCWTLATVHCSPHSARDKHLVALFGYVHGHCHWT